MIVIGVCAAVFGCGGNIGDPSIDTDAQPRSTDAAPGQPDAAVDAMPTLVPAACDDGDVRVSDPTSGNCYVRFDEVVTWNVASARCQAAGAHLVSIESAAENDIVASIAPDNAVEPTDFDVWIGANDIATEATWAWEVTAEPFVFTQWRDGEPNNSVNTDPTGENCAVFEGDSLEWDDRSCTLSSFKYVCEREATLE